MPHAPGPDASGPKTPGPVRPAAEPGTDEVLRALIERRGTGSRGDGRRIALVVSGGGMRGAYSGGMVHALQDAGYGDCFDVVYGSSAGAFVGAALLLGSGDGAARIFHEDMASRAFIDPRRLGSGRPMVSLDHLFDEIMATRKPMPWERLAGLGRRLRVLATDARTLQPEILEPRSVADWRLAMRATAAIPYLTGGPVRLGDRLFVDGSVSEPVPLSAALAGRPTHVLVLLNRTWAELAAGPPTGRPALWARSLDRLRPGAGSMIQERVRMAPAVAVLTDPVHAARGEAKLTALAPGADAGIRGLTIDPAPVRRAAELGYQAVTRVLPG